jgi:hypothetical protein
MKQPRGCGARHVLASAIVVALAGSVSAAEPSLRVLSSIADGITTQADIELTDVEFRPGSKLLLARSRAGNVECAQQSTAVGDVLKLELDGKQYAIRTSALPTGLSAPISYAPGSARFSLSLDQIASADCASTGVTMFDFVMVGPNGQATARARVAELVRVLLPTSVAPYPVTVLRVADPLHCESYGIDEPGMVGDLTYSNGTVPVPLFGLDRVDYQLASVNGRRELRHVSRVSDEGVQLVQCTSPGLLMGALTAGGAAPGLLFGSSFERREAQADVELALDSDWRIGSDSNTLAAVDKIGFVGESGAYLALTVRNVGRSDAVGVKVREYLRNGADAEMQVSDGDAASCTPLPENAQPNPCTGLNLGFPLRFDLPVLPRGHGVALQLHRRLENAIEGQQIAVGYAAFVSPLPTSTAAADATLGNNSQWLNFAIS